MSVELTEWAALTSCVKSPVGSNLASLLRSMALLTDSELLALELPVIRNKVTVWDSARHGCVEADQLPIVDGNRKISITCKMYGDSLAGFNLVHQAVLIVKRDFPSFTATTLDEIIIKAFPD